MSERVTLRDYEEEETDRGVKYYATILLDGKDIGCVYHEGRGGNTVVQIEKERETVIKEAYKYFDRLHWYYLDEPQRNVLITFVEHLIDIHVHGEVSNEFLALGFLI